MSTATHKGAVCIVQPQPPGCDVRGIWRTAPLVATVKWDSAHGIVHKVFK